jgi:hypothetical protein
MWTTRTFYLLLNLVLHYWGITLLVHSQGPHTSSPLARGFRVLKGRQSPVYIPVSCSCISTPIRCWHRRAPELSARSGLAAFPWHPDGTAATILLHLPLPGKSRKWSRCLWTGTQNHAWALTLARVLVLTNLHQNAHMHRHTHTQSHELTHTRTYKTCAHLKLCRVWENHKERISGSFQTLNSLTDISDTISGRLPPYFGQVRIWCCGQANRHETPLGTCSLY